MKLVYIRALQACLFFSFYLVSCGEVRSPESISPADRARYNSLQQTGLNLISSQDSVHFWPFLDSVLELSQHESSEFLELRALQLKQMYLENAGQLEKALTITEAVIKRTEGQPALQEIHVEALFNKGDISFRLGQYQTAFEAYFIARKEIVAPDTCELGYYDYCLAMVAYRQKNFQSALELFKSAEKNYRRCGSSFTKKLKRQEINSNIGLCYMNLNQPDSALYWFGRARISLLHTRSHSESEKRIHKIGLAVISGNVGVAYARLGELDKAKAAIQSELEVNLLPGNDRGHLVYSINELCELLLKENKLDEMYAYLRLLDSLPELRTHRFPAYRFYNHKLQYHIRKGDNSLAILYADSFLQVYEGLRKEDRDLFRTDLGRSMRILETEYELKQAEQTASLASQRSAYVLLLFVSFLLLTLLFLYAWLAGRRNNRALTQLNQEKDKMLRVVAHDLRNPIAAIYSLSDLNLTANPTAPAAKDWRLVEEACSGALELIQDMLIVTTLKDPRRDEKYTAVSINQLCSDTIRLIQYQADEKQISLSYEALEKDCLLQLAPERIRRAITNLLTNAIKFSTSGSTVTLQLELNEMGVLISVQDHGIGIPASYKDKIFQSFTSVRRAGTSGELAYGLGLSIVKEIVEAHQGKIWYISKEGEGSSFFIQLPL